MAATAEQKKQFQTEQKTFKSDIEGLNKEISLMKKVMRDQPNIKGYVQVGMAINHLKVTGNYLAISDISMEILSLKNESYLNNARKEIYKVLQSLEEIVSNDIDLTLNENRENLVDIARMAPLQKLNILKAIKTSITGMVTRFGPNTKWRWSFQELYSRLAVISKNLTDWRQVEQNRDPRKPDFQTINLLSRFVKDELYTAAQEYKAKYDLADAKTDEDLKHIIKLFDALIRIHNHFGEQEDAQRIKTLMEAVKETLEKNTEEAKKASSGKAPAKKGAKNKKKKK